MRHFPAFLDLRGRTVLLLGSGEVAARKAEPLRRAGAIIRQADSFAPAMLDGVVLAVGADAPDAELRALSEAAQARGIPVNVVDRPALCSFITPAIIDRAPVTVAVSTGGAAPVLARMIRQRIETLLPPAIGTLAALAERFQAAIRARLPDLAARRRFLDQALTGAPADLALAGRVEEAEAAFAAALDASDTTPPGIVYLVGAGPGAADLLTLRALRLMGEADVIVHDRLVTAEVLDMARRDAERILVGKAGAAHSLPQDGINALLVRLAREGRRVVRLKGGDPYVFGRGGDEILALREAGIAHEVVPGVTAALACAASAGIPLTHRDAARTVTFATGHLRDGRLDLDFAALARPRQTIAVYMGLASLPLLRDGLVGAGMDPATPAAIIENGGTDRARSLPGTIGTIAALAEGWASGAPALVLVGGAVALGAPPAAS
ncbi:siroheme synthase CysG [Falsiroseomonas stagni]|uniref:Uroporphyrinogen-III C-methyltransferase n=1 Tax=Falsiroseomonas stagni DSM 19981 TaxID=1123062 RepID=A0A1I4BA54_9PROT|nr:siroheme synthase CysG [Falsiroseomonas stagni]SFK64826.1 uroporphyrinogen-III C-methyltransferase [Falsiroseomonas stagni DSM 19981]